jgi:hypothetical protein
MPITRSGEVASGRWLADMLVLLFYFRTFPWAIVEMLPDEFFTAICDSARWNGV